MQGSTSQRNKMEKYTFFHSCKKQSTREWFIFCFVNFEISCLASEKLVIYLSCRATICFAQSTNAKWVMGSAVAFLDLFRMDQHKHSLLYFIVERHVSSQPFKYISLLFLKKNEFETNGHLKHFRKWKLKLKNHFQSDMSQLYKIRRKYCWQCHKVLQKIFVVVLKFLHAEALINWSFVGGIYSKSIRCHTDARAWRNVIRMI